MGILLSFPKLLKDGPAVQCFADIILMGNASLRSYCHVIFVFPFFFHIPGVMCHRGETCEVRTFSTSLGFVCCSPKNFIFILKTLLFIPFSQSAFVFPPTRVEAMGVNTLEGFHQRLVEGIFTQT